MRLLIIMMQSGKLEFYECKKVLSENVDEK